MPIDTYIGINAATKAALLGELSLAKELAGRVLECLKEQERVRGGWPLRQLLRARDGAECPAAHR